MKIVARIAVAVIIVSILIGAILDGIVQFQHAGVSVAIDHVVWHVLELCADFTEFMFVFILFCLGVAFVIKGETDFYSKLFRNDLALIILFLFFIMAFVHHVSIATSGAH